VSEVEGQSSKKHELYAPRSGPGLVLQKNTQQMIDFGHFLRLE